MRFEEKKVGDVLRKRNGYTDHIGVEIETEGQRLPKVDSELWRSDVDNSLRGEAWEYVLKEPVHKDKLHEAMEEMKAEWKKAKSVVKDSPNAGVHVHINVSDLTVTELYNYLALYLVMEEILIDKCGTNRIGNLFCLRASDAEYLLDMLAEAIKTTDLSILHTDDLRYAAVNVKALGDYGSIEFRAWPSNGDLKGIEWWANILMHLKQVAKATDNPAQVVGDISMHSPEVFFKSIMKEYADDIEWKHSYNQSMMEGVRRVQQFAFEGAW
ncbi:putative amidoligase [Citrobacter phage CVT22]|uniref:Amidoligase n=1 Tax=Citrobacter phage CVT22 TaxID=1622234 RepID=A0A0R6CMM8_9CAUD|nr:amidoligase enzyme [Citrobacter phage CVT22]AJT60758.1 putative amidoligase [Citrobacter phage CVT22]